MEEAKKSEQEELQGPSQDLSLYDHSGQGQARIGELYLRGKDREGIFRESWSYLSEAISVACSTRCILSYFKESLLFK